MPKKDRPARPAAQAARRRRATPYKLLINVPINGRTHAATIKAQDRAGKTLHEDRANLSDARERRRVARALHAKLRLRDPDKALRDLEKAYYAELDKHQKAAGQGDQGGEGPPPAAREADPAYPYLVQNGCICRRRFGRDGEEFVEPLCNFDARIDEEATHDDCSGELRLFFTVAGTLCDGTPLPDATVPAAGFAAMRWVLEAWGSRACPNAGQGATDHLRAALQKLSAPGVRRRTIYTHAGWRSVGGRWVYLHAGGAIGAIGTVDGIETLLPDTLARAVLPPPPRGEALADAVRASLALLDLGPERVTAPLLGAAYRAALPEVDFSLALVGASGVFKSEGAALFQQHFGAEFNARNLPANWSSTANALEGLAYAAKDMLLTVDDFAPGGSAGDVARMHRDADRLFRGVGNRAGRARLRADGSLRPTRPPRALVLSTGEELPRGHSVRGRMGIVELARGDIAPERLSRCQLDAAAGKYRLAMSGYVRWLAKRYEHVLATIRQQTLDLRRRYHDADQHARTPGIRADLALGWDYLLRFAQDAQAVTAQEAADYRERAEVGLRLMAQAQAAHQQAAEPVALFVSLLRSAVASGRAHAASPLGLQPADRPEAWGWRKEDGRDGPAWKPQGRRVGWVDSADLFLDPEASHAEVQRFAGEQGESFPIASKTLSKRLDEKKKLKAADRARGRLTVRKTVESRRMDVWHLDAAEVLGTD
jgi:hypothetical protein